MPLASSGDSEFDNIASEGVLVCPHCGNEEEDVDFVDDHRYEGEEVCSACGGKYSFYAEVTVQWTTRKVE